SAVAPGVTSRALRPVPPVVITRAARAAAARMAAAMAGRSPATTTGPSASRPAARSRRQASGPDASGRAPRATESLTVMTTARAAAGMDALTPAETVL